MHFASVFYLMLENNHPTCLVKKNFKKLLKPKQSGLSGNCFQEQLCPININTAKHYVEFLFKVCVPGHNTCHSFGYLYFLLGVKWYWACVLMSHIWTENIITRFNYWVQSPVALLWLTPCRGLLGITLSDARRAVVPSFSWWLPFGLGQMGVCTHPLPPSLSRSVVLKVWCQNQ